MTVAAETLAAYERWAPLYPPVPHNPLMRAEQAAMLSYWPEVAGRRVLDLAAGTGRYSQLLADSHAAQVIAVDFCVPMLARLSTALVCHSLLAIQHQVMLDVCEFNHYA